MRIRRRWLWMGCLGIALTSAPVAAQRLPPRDTVPSPPTLDSLGGPGSRGQVMPYPVRFNEAQRRGFRWGARAGFVAGAVTGYLLLPGCDASNLGCVAYPVVIMFYVGGGGLVGGLLGGVTGFVIATATDGEPSFEVRIPAP